MTLGQMLRETVGRFGDRTAFVTLGKEAISWSYQEVFTRVKGFAVTLRASGLTRGDRVCIVSENCPEWALFDWACQCLGLVVVPIYPTLPADQTRYIVQNCGAAMVVGGAEDQLKKVAGMEGVRTILLKGPGSLTEQAAIREFDSGEFNAEIDAGLTDAPSTIIYTSGTTGTPKGAVMPNRAFVHVCHTAKGHIHLTENDRFLSFLPMSHVYERVAGQCLPVSLGATICYSRGLASLATEMKEYRPTIMLTVPRFLENLRERILSSVQKDKPLRQKLFHLALSQGVKKAKGQFAPLFPILDKLVGAKVRERTGGELRYFVSGGAALEPVVAEFYMAVGLNVLQGYGLTETCGGTFVNRPENNKYWTVGEALDMECKIGEDGEILIRGDALMLGYYEMPEETAQAIDPQGWFHTGDIGEFEGRNLKITDRKKDILVLANGKNVAPQMIENKLKVSPYIQEAVVLGDKMEFCVALIVPNFEAVRNALHLGDEVVLSGNAEAKALIKKEIDAVNKSVAAFEMVKKHALLDQPFSIESGEITPTLKVKRKFVEKKFASVIDGLR
ncbi:MAG TPA: long-chain fatty acid--CoA ligase [Fimbriimonas sp.]|nr:long-chain fatty acid--CoA ligase [Fimbriimonas sp.]